MGSWLSSLARWRFGNNQSTREAPPALASKRQPNYRRLRTQYYRAAKEPHERSWWQILWLLARGQLAKDIAESTGYSRYWIGQIAKRYNAAGPEGMRNRQYTHSHRSAPLLAPELLAELARAVRGPAPAGDDH